MPDFEIVLWDNARVYMLDWGRAKTGAPHFKFPDIDEVGFQDAAFPNEHGPVVSAMVGQFDASVSFYRTEVSKAAKLFAVSLDPGIAKITAPAGGQLAGDVSQNIEFEAVAAGRTAFEIRYNQLDGPVLGRLYVQIYEKILIKMHVHIVTIVQRDASGAIKARVDPPNPFLGANCSTRDEKIARIKAVVRDANHVWIPHGIGFVMDDVVDTEWGRTEIGSDKTALIPTDLFQPGALSPNRSATQVNVYCVPLNFADAAAMGVDPVLAAKLKVLFRDTGGVQHNPGALYLASAYQPHEDNFGTTIAHELGHYMTLAANSDPKHSTSDLPGGPEAIRDDIVTRRRLMYLADGLMDPFPARYSWRAETSYGRGKSAGRQGAFITHRRLPDKQDVTFQESQRARDATKVPGFYSA